MTPANARAIITSPLPSPTVPTAGSFPLQVRRDTLPRFATLPALSPFGRLAPERVDGSAVANRRLTRMAEERQQLMLDAWRRSTLLGLEAAAAQGTGNVRGGTSDVVMVPDDPESIGTADRPVDLFGEYADLGLELAARLEAKAERQKNERCDASQFFNPVSNCAGTFQPQFDFQFNVRTGGVVADRIHVNVDYDSEREFDASNNISVYYQGKTDELLERLEVGNVSFQPAASRFLTSGIPSGNYGIQAIGQLGPMRFRTIVAQQKGNVVKDRVFTVGDRTLQTVTRDIEDYQVEPRRFFFTIDPRRLQNYPNIDILDGQRLAQLAEQLPAELRPTKVYVYRQTIAGPQPNLQGPEFFLRGSKAQSRQLFEYLREGVDYYVDPSNLWIALVRPLNVQNERLAIAYTIGAGVRTDSGGTPDLSRTDAGQFANLLYERGLEPRDDAFWREIRSVYRVGGDDIRRESVQMRITTGAGDQEKPVGGAAATYLQQFGLAQPSNPSVFDVDRRLWPRPSDPNYNRDAGGQGTKLIRDYFVVLPSLQPFAAAGLATPPNPTNDTIYRTLGEDLYSSRRPVTLYNLRARYEAEGGGEVGTLALGAVQLRQNSERIAVGGVPLVRGTDYTVDYELGRVTFARPDTLFLQPRQVSVQYEENPLFASAPTSIFGLAAEFPLTSGQLNFTAISQSQKTTFNRPPLGFEPASSFVAGMSGAFTFDAAPLTRAIERLPFIETTAPSQVYVSGEIATSRPQPNAAGQAYVESFEGEGGIQLPLADGAWYYSSVPPPSPGLDARVGVMLDTTRASTMVWQNNGVFLNATLAQFRFSQIDTLVTTAGGGFESFEQLLWLTLYPRNAFGMLRNRNDVLAPRWTAADQPTGRRWRSLRIGLGASGADLSRVETLEFWALVETQPDRLGKNPVLAFDFGEISENSVSFTPETLHVNTAGNDTTYTGRRTQGWNVLDTERDPLSRSFDVSRNDIGIGGDLARGIFVIDSTQGGAPTFVDSLPVCRGQPGLIQLIGDTRANCSVRNNRLDEEDIDQDFQLNLTSDQQLSGESWYRYVIDLSDERNFARIGGGVRVQTGDSVGGVPETALKNWVLVRVPFRMATDSLGSFNPRRVRAMRLTMVSGAGAVDEEYTTVPLARLKLVGSPWLKRTESFARGIAGDEPTGQGNVVAGMVGTTDRGTSGGGLGYVSPPGVTDQTDSKQTGFESGVVQINERSLRLTATPAMAMRKYDRAEAYFRFPEGQKNFMGYQQLRVWARGRNSGWGEDGELQFYVKIGRDASNFYLYRTPVNSGEGITAWLPEVSVDFNRFYALRAQIQNAYLQGGTKNSCTGVDSALIARSRLPNGVSDSLVYAACSDGYMVLTADPAISPPNLAGVQELAVGMVRVDSATGPQRIADGDTLELWVDDIRLTGVVDTPGYAGQVGVDVVAGDLATVRMNVSRRDPHFRQLAEQPSFITADAFDISTSVRLDRLLPSRLGVALPFTVSHSSQGSDPFFLENSDLRGAGIEGLRTPQSGATSFGLDVRRLTPTTGMLAPVLNNISLNARYNMGESRSAYTEARSRSVALGADYRIASRERTARMPGWVGRVVGALPDFIGESEPLQAFARSNIRLTPTQFSLSSSMVRSTDRSLAFIKPAETSTDSARLAQNLTHLWRNGSSLELRPFQSLSMRWNLNSLRDMRRYRDSLLANGPGANPTAVSPAEVASAERDELLGLDLGLERERQMTSGVSFTPQVSPWLRPRAEFSTSFSMQRNPSDRTILRTGDTTGAFRLPRRFSNSQNLNLGTTVDVGRLLVIHTSEKNFLRRFVTTVQPIDVTWNRSLLSSFDGVAFSPGLGYQFGIGNEQSFRGLDGRTATNAGVTRTISASTRVGLPFQLSIATRFQRNATESWVRRLNGGVGETRGLTTSYPDVTLSWNYRPPFLARWISSIGTSAGYHRSSAETESRSEQQGVGAERGESRNERIPVTATIAWSFFGGITTAAGWSTSEREDSRPGTRNVSATEDMTFDVARSFKLPQRWKARGDLRTRFSYQQSASESAVLATAAADDRRSSLSDNGRRAFNLNADTDLAENLMGSLTVSRVLTFDNQFDRRFSQTVISAVLDIRFYAGELR